MSMTSIQRHQGLRNLLRQFAQTFREERKRLGLSVEAVSDAVKIKRESLDAIEAGRLEHWSHFIRLADFYGLEIRLGPPR